MISTANRNVPWLPLGVPVSETPTSFHFLIIGEPMSNRTDNDSVVKAWSRSRKAESHTNNLSTDGRLLHSYSLLIGFTADDGSKVLLDYTAPAQCFRSMTTSAHVGLAKRAADDIMHPKAADLAGFTCLDLPF